MHGMHLPLFSVGSALRPQQGEAHWNEEAKALIASLLMHVVASEPAATRTLATLRDHLTLAPVGFASLLDRMQKAGGLVARAAIPTSSTAPA